eukprot:TRINITY_DN782165_c0_g1_i1.p1 TRINITY_DN782165_c0_g1~~TRINITY_DN782165_c0_g1_i1.p1  ORF type:complete len:425 (-),score=139.56 TRINITY_DN782165_c0_g1_i1:458-1732(-)
MDSAIEHANQKLQTVEDHLFMSLPKIEDGSAESVKNFYGELCADLDVNSENLVNLWTEEAMPDNGRPLGETEIQDLRRSSIFRPRRSAIHSHENICVFGGGAYGTAVSNVLAYKGHNVKILMLPCEEEHVRSINEKHINSFCFPDVTLPMNITATVDVDEGLRDASFIVHAVPVQFSEKYLAAFREKISPSVPIICVSKGINARSLEVMSDVIPRALQRDHPTAYLCGPSFAKQMMVLEPTMVSLASTSQEVGMACQLLLSSPVFRVFTCQDVIGLEIGSALKNVIAIGCGIASGLEYGPNTQCAIVTRGWADIRQVARAMGAKEDTLSGLAGIGDVMLTCFGGLSRNAKFGQNLASGMNAEDACRKVGAAVEGYPTAGAVMRLAAKFDIDVPVLRAINAVIEGKLTAPEMINHVMMMPLTPEM